MSQPEMRTLAAADGYQISYRCYAPPAGRQPRGIVVYLHGIQSHGGWYEASAQHLAEAGFAVYLPDRRGSGLNQAERGHCESWEELARDVTDLEEQALADWRPRRAGARLPLFLVAVSWGGKLAAALAAMHDGRYAGLALLCPGICPRRDVSCLTKLRIAAALAPMLQLHRGLAAGKPRKMFPIPLADPRLFTATPRWLEFLRADRLALHEATARFLYESRRLDDQAAQAARWIHTPVFLALAENDQIIDNVATRRYFGRIAAEDKTVRCYADAQHTLEFEPHPRLVFDDLVTWLDGRCEKKP